MEDQTASSSSSSVHSSSTSSAPSSTTSSALSCSTSLDQLDASATSVITSTGSFNQDVKKTKKKKKKKTKKVVVKKREEVEDIVTKKANENGFIKERPKLAQSTIKQMKRKNEDEPPTAPQRKHLKRGPRVNYSEMDVPDDDHYLCE